MMYGFVDFLQKIKTKSIIPNEDILDCFNYSLITIIFYVANKLPYYIKQQN